MSDYVFYEFRGNVPLPPGAELLPLPVRSERQAQVFGGPEVRVGLLPEELAAFLGERPDLAVRYRRTMGTLTWLAAVEEGLKGDHASAERHLMMGLRAEPGDVLLRSNYALVLQLRERNAEALEQYQVVFADPVGAKNPAVRLLAARIHAQQKRFREAYDLLQPLAVYYPDGAYQDMLRRMKELADADGDGVRAAATVTGTCAICGTQLGPEQRFCYKCGRPVMSQVAPEPAPATTSAIAMAPVTAPAPVVASAPAVTAAMFCGWCGAPAEQGQVFCYKCGKRL